MRILLKSMKILLKALKAGVIGSGIGFSVSIGFFAPDALAGFGVVAGALFSAALSAGSVASFLGVSTFTGFLISFAGNLALSALQSFLSPTPQKSPGVSALPDRAITVMIRAPAEPHRIVGGMRRVSGPWGFAATSGTRNQHLHLIIELCGVSVTSMDPVYFFDVPIVASDIDEPGEDSFGRITASGHAYRQVAWIKKHLGFDPFRKVWQEDVSGGPSFIDLTTDINDFGLADVSPFPAGAGVNDAIYFGVAGQTMRHIQVDVSTAGVGTYALTWEYWNGTAYTAVSGLTDGTLGFKITGEKEVSFTRPTDWVADTVNGKTAFYLRAKRDAGTVTIDPVFNRAWTELAELMMLIGTDPDDTAPFPASKLIASEWTNEHILRGIAYLYINLRHVANPDSGVSASKAFPDGIPNISARVKGFRVFDPRDGITRWTNNSALIVHHYLTATVRVSPLLGVPNEPLGLAVVADEIDLPSVINAANICDEPVQLRSDLATAIMVADDVTDILTETVTDPNKPIPVHQGDIVEFTTTDTLPSPLVIDRGYYAIEVGIDGQFKLALSLNDSREDIVINIADAGTGVHTMTRVAQQRYTTDLVWSTADSRADIVQRMASAMFGTVIYSQGKYTMYAGAWRGPAVRVLSETDLRGPLEHVAKPSVRELHNATKGVFVDRDGLDLIADFPAITNSIFETEDGRRIYKDVELPGVSDVYAAQRIAKLINERDRRAGVIKFPAKMSAFDLTIGTHVMISVGHLGVTNDTYEVVDWKFSEDFGIDLTLQRTEESIYNFDPNTDTVKVDRPVNVTLPDDKVVTVPTNFVFSSEGLLTSEGLFVLALNVVWDAPQDSLVIDGGGFDVQIKKSSITAYPGGTFVLADPIQDPEQDPIQARIRIQGLETGVLYDLRVRSVNAFGVVSAFVETPGFDPSDNMKVDLGLASESDPIRFVNFGLASGEVIHKIDFGLASDPPNV